MEIPEASLCMSRRGMILGAASGLLGTTWQRCVAGSDQQLAAAAVERGVGWLFQQQAQDGGWHSETYGNMRGGAGNTALILAALSQTSSERRTDIQTAFERGVRFLTSNLDAKGLVQPPTGVADYPVSATELLLRALSQRPIAVAAEFKQRLCRGLQLAQRGGANGWPEDHPDFGGWGLTADDDANATPANPSNLSATAGVLSALKLHDVLTPAVRRDAMAFLARCQCRQIENDDAGGFAFTVRADDPLNKAGWKRTENGPVQARPYPTATCDGVLALLACGVAHHDSRISAAITWLSRQPLADDEQSQSFRQGLAFYEARAWASVCRSLVDPILLKGHHRHVELLLASQRSDGSWSNSYAEMREDDPLIATAFAVQALMEIPTSLSKK